MPFGHRKGKRKMIRIFYLFILGALLYWAVRGLFGQTGHPPKRGPEGEEMVQDPQCGVYIPKSRALLANRRGKQLFFCSEECKKKYLSSDREN